MLETEFKFDQFRHRESEPDDERERTTSFRSSLSKTAAERFGPRLTNHPGRTA
jgi:hypothetical protein